jgi:hypothetical protein
MEDPGNWRAAGDATGHGVNVRTGGGLVGALVVLVDAWFAATNEMLPAVFRVLLDQRNLEERNPDPSTSHRSLNKRHIWYC